MKTSTGVGVLAAAAFAVMVPGFSGPAFAKDLKYFRSMKKDAETPLMRHTSFRGDCETKAAEIKILEQPKNGQAAVKTGTRKFPKGGKGNLAKCDGKTGAAAAVVYKPKSGFEGFDQLKYEVTFASGNKNTVSYRLKIGDPKKSDDGKGWVKAK
ncbi:MAG: hypothetical protein AB7F96_21490 [Beijerinckiaceae bacterium]